MGTPRGCPGRCAEAPGLRGLGGVASGLAGHDRPLLLLPISTTTIVIVITVTITLVIIVIFMIILEGLSLSWTSRLLRVRGFQRLVDGEGREDEDVPFLCVESRWSVEPQLPRLCWWPFLVEKSHKKGLGLRRQSLGFR